MNAKKFAHSEHKFCETRHIRSKLRICSRFLKLSLTRTFILHSLFNIILISQDLYDIERLHVAVIHDCSFR